MKCCADAGISVEVVPGVSSATAAAALAGNPLTSSEGAADFCVVSGHHDPDDPACLIDWSAVSRTGTNLVILMGMRHLLAIVARLIREGIAADAAATCITNAGLPPRMAPLPAPAEEDHDLRLGSPVPCAS